MERIPNPTPVTPSELRRAAALDARLGNLYFRLKRPEARQVLERGLAEGRAAKDVTWQAWILMRQGEMDEESHTEVALERYREAAETYGREGNGLQQASSLQYVRTPTLV